MTPAWVEIDLSAIRRNYRKIKEKVKVKVICVVKANAYGHGLEEVTQALEEEGADFFAVGNVKEGILLRKKGIISPILVLSSPENEREVEESLRFNLTPSLSLERGVETLGKKKGIKIHLEVDTGMERTGFTYREIKKWVSRIKALSFRVEGIYSHFASAEKDRKFSLLQLKRFKEVIKIFQKMGIDPPLKHMANSAGVINFPESYFDAVRVGLLLYGCSPSPSSLKVEPSMSFKTHILSLRKVPPATSIGYGRTFFTRGFTRVALLPVGYADGYPFSLSNRGRVLIRGKLYPVVGRVCMDHIMVKANSLLREGDEVVLWGKNREGKEIRVEEVARWATSIPYEIVTRIGERVSRIYLEGGKIIKVVD